MRPNIAAIIITGYKDDMIKMIDQVLNKNAHVCFEKPINMERLKSIIKEIEEQKVKGYPK